MGKEGYHSLYKWYQGFEAEHFPDPKGLRDTVARWTLHIYPKCIQAAMALFDVPEAIAVSRTKICTAGGVMHLTRLQVCPFAMRLMKYSLPCVCLVVLTSCCYPFCHVLWTCMLCGVCLHFRRSLCPVWLQSCCPCGDFCAAVTLSTAFTAVVCSVSVCLSVCVPACLCVVCVSVSVSLQPPGSSSAGGHTLLSLSSSQCCSASCCCYPEP